MRHVARAHISSPLSRTFRSSRKHRERGWKRGLKQSTELVSTNRTNDVLVRRVLLGKLVRFTHSTIQLLPYHAQADDYRVTAGAGLVETRVWP
jgi:hypothetical protein